jgi:hypothetical protein
MKHLDLCKLQAIILGDSMGAVTAKNAAASASTTLALLPEVLTLHHRTTEPSTLLLRIPSSSFKLT